MVQLFQIPHEILPRPPPKHGHCASHCILPWSAQGVKDRALGDLGSEPEVTAKLLQELTYAIASPCD